MLVQSIQRPLSLTLVATSSALVILILYISYNKTSSTTSSFLHLTQHPSYNLLDHVFNETLGFENVFVISLPMRTDRRDTILLAAALSGIKIEFIDGVVGETVSDKVLPPGGGREHLRDGEIGCWRAHANAMEAVIQRNLSSVLILEDDADWDVRVHSQLHDFALSSLALTQPLSYKPSTYADVTYPSPREALQVPASDLQFDSLPLTILPRISPYGDNWDLLWLGHCGMRFPSGSEPFTEHIPKGRVIYNLDPTIPEKQYLQTLSSTDDLQEYPSHTRAVHHASEGICSLGYAVSQAGARRLLHSIAVLEVTSPYDFQLRKFCEGSTTAKSHNCLTVQPALFKHHRPIGPMQSGSDISDHGPEYRDKAKTDNIRWSTRMNLQELLDGATSFSDQYPDTSNL